MSQTERDLVQGIVELARDTQGEPEYFRAGVEMLVQTAANEFRREGREQFAARLRQLQERHGL